jgi:hypothetical protein
MRRKTPTSIPNIGLVMPDKLMGGAGQALTASVLISLGFDTFALARGCYSEGISNTVGNGAMNPQYAMQITIAQ